MSSLPAVSLRALIRASGMSVDQFVGLL